MSEDFKLPTVSMIDADERIPIRITSEIGVSNHRFIQQIFDGVLKNDAEAVKEGFQKIGNQQAKAMIFEYLKSYSPLKGIPGVETTLKKGFLH